MADPFSYIDVSSAYSDGTLTVTIKTRDGFTGNVVALALSKLGSCESNSAITASDTSTSPDSQTNTSDKNSTADTEATEPITPVPGPTPQMGFVGEIKFRATIGGVSGETGPITTGNTSNSTLADNRTFTITIHSPPTGDTLTLEILGAMGDCQVIIATAKENTG